MLAALEIIVAIVISWPAALLAVNAPNNRNSWVTLAAFAGVVLVFVLLWDAASGSRAAVGIFTGYECGSGPFKWDC